jgi:hypothetical protein
MRMLTWRVTVGALIVAFSIAVPAWSASPSPTPGSSQKATAWSKKMRKLYEALGDLMTQVSSDARFKNPKNRAKIEAGAKRLSELAHDMKAGKVTPPDSDPSIGIFTSLFADSARAAYRSLKNGHVEYSRELLRSLPGYCIACHTRNSSGPSFVSLPMEPTSRDLKPIEAGGFYASTRQYNRALKEFARVIEDQTVAASSPIEWGHAVEYALVIAVRVNKNPLEAEKLVKQVLDNSEAPFFMKENARNWLKSIESWKNESTRTATNEEGFYTEAVRLLGQAHEVQRYPVDRSADILFLRASSAVHDLLQSHGPGRHTGEAYLMAGICYEVLRPFRIGELHELYYETCVRIAAHTPLASACFHRYQESVYFNYTGSSGTHLPEDEKSKLRTLQELTIIPGASEKLQ